MLRLAFAISEWLCSLFFANISFKLLYSFFCIKSTIKIVVVVVVMYNKKRSLPLSVTRFELRTKAYAVMRYTEHAVLCWSRVVTQHSLSNYKFLANCTAVKKHANHHILRGICFVNYDNSKLFSRLIKPR